MSGSLCAAIAIATATLATVGVGQAPANARNVISSSAGVDGSLLAWSLGYARAASLSRGRRLLVGAQFTLPMGRPDLGDWRVTAGARVELIRRGRFAWPVEGDLLVRSLTTRAVQSWGLGTELAAMPGWYPGRWFIAAEFAWDQQWATRLRHRDIYRVVVYEDVVDGWYRASGFTMRYGARVGGSPARRLELWLRAGYEQHGRLDRLAPPVYALLGVSVGL